MARRSASPNFIESLARGLDVICAFQPNEPVAALSTLASRTGLARPTAHRILQTLTELGYVRVVDGGFALTPKVIELGMAYVDSLGLWEAARPHMEDLVADVHESSSIVELEGSDIVYVARVAVPKIVGLSVSIGTRFPAVQTALGKVILADLDPTELDRVLAIPSRSGVVPRRVPTREEIDAALDTAREQGWALADQELAQGIRSVAVPLRGSGGRTLAAINVNTHAAETSIDTLLSRYLPRLRVAADRISADWAQLLNRPHVVAPGPADAPVATAR